jgi:hypothetical protein
MWGRRGTQIVARCFVIAGSAIVGWISRDGSDRLLESSEDGEASADKPVSKEERRVSFNSRAELLSRAQIWRKLRLPIPQATFTDLNLDGTDCRFELSTLGGTTPKFDCVLDSGEEIRIKYGNGPEVPAETAATRLLAALGFGADHITLVKTLRCYGCPKEPFSIMKTVEITRAEPLYKHVLDYSVFEEFAWVALERKFNARPIETDRLEGWAMFELDMIDERKGGAPRAHVDALRLIAVLLAHWDNKAENQRLVCLDREWAEDAPCARPFLLLQDVGATFGPTKMDLDAWTAAPVWEDRSQCTVSMRHLPFEGATFGRATITEAGRSFLGGLLSQLSDTQLHDLFSGARFAEKRGPFSATRTIPEWIAAFRTKVRAITDGPRCPRLS